MKKIFAILPLALATMTVFAENGAETNITETMNGSTFEFSTQVSRTVERDLMQATVYSRKTGKSLAELKKGVSADLNKVLAFAKQQANVEVQTDGISNHANYNEKGKVDGWVAEGYINLKSKDFEAMAKVLENLGDNVAISSVNFSVSPEKMAALEDEMTLDIIKQFQHKAEVIQKGLQAKNYRLTNVQLHTPNGQNYGENRPLMAMAKMERSAMDEMPLEAGKETISATASGKIKFE